MGHLDKHIFPIAIKTRVEILDEICKTKDEHYIMDAIIEDVEKQIAKGIYLKKYTSMPYIGSIRENKRRTSCIKNRELVNSKREELTTEEFKDFKRKLSKKEIQIIDRTRRLLYNLRYTTKRYKKHFRKFCKSESECMAAAKCYYLTKMTYHEER